MSRTVSKDHAQMFVADWRQRLLSASLEAEQPSKRQARFEAVLGWTEKSPPASVSANLGRALAGYISALQLDRRNHAKVYPAIDAWIVRFLLTRGPELLISEATRRTHLANIRDGHRRRARADHGYRAATIEMPAAAWKELGRIRDSRGMRTLGAAVAALISEAGAAKSTDREVRSRSATVAPTLFTADALPPRRRRPPNDAT
jgi:hypothetical protein